MRKLGVIAGGGALPAALVGHCVAAGRPVFVLRLRNFADVSIAAIAPGADVALGEFGRSFDLLRSEGCEAVCFAGHVARPNLADLQVDAQGMRVLPKLLAASLRGDDSLLRVVLNAFRSEGFAVEGAQDVDQTLTLPLGPLGRFDLGEADRADVALALRIARATGALDIGQGCVVARGLVLAVEAQEGTDAMLRRCAELSPSLRGTAKARVGVLAKAPKPIQEREVDLPVIGVATVEGAAAAGLAGVVGEAGGVLILERAAMGAAADRLGLFVVGLPAQADGTMN